MERQLQKYNVNPETWFGDRTAITVEDVMSCVQKGMLTEMDARDLARCVATEAASHVDVYTVSQEKAALYDSKRHLFANFNRHSFVHQMHVAFAVDENGNRQREREDSNAIRRRSFHANYKIRYRQAILDYFWIPHGWDDNHWSRSFFADVLPDLMRQGMLEIEDDNNPSNNLPCGVYLPFCFHCFRQIINALPVLRQYYAISFLRRKDLHEISLWKGTQTIDRYSMQKKLGKDLSQENIYCTFGYQEVMQAGTSARDEPRETLVNILSRLEDFKEIRMIKLRPLRQYHPTINLPEEKHEIGGLKGLVDPKLVKRGFMATAEVTKEFHTGPRRRTTVSKAFTKPTTTPDAKTAATKRVSSGSVPRKSKRAPTVSTRSRKKKAGPAATPIVGNSPPASPERGLSHRGMPTRSRTRALFASCPPTAAPLRGADSSTYPRRSSCCNVIYVSLPAEAGRNRNPSVMSAINEVFETRNISKQGPDASHQTRVKMPENKGTFAEDNEDLTCQHKTAEVSLVAATRSQQQYSLIEVMETVDNKADQAAKYLNPDATLASANATEGVLTIPAPKQTQKTTNYDSSESLPVISGATATLHGRGDETKAASTAAAVTPSPSTLASKGKSRNKASVLVESMALYALPSAKSVPQEVAKKMKVAALAKSVPQRQATNVLGTAHESKQGKSQPMPGASLASWSLTAIRNSCFQQSTGLKKDRNKEKARGPVPSTLMGSNDQGHLKASSGSSSVAELEERVVVDDAFANGSGCQSENTRTECFSVLETSEQGLEPDFERPCVLIKLDRELSDISMGPGLTTRERLELLGFKLDPEARTNTPPHGTLRMAAPLFMRAVLASPNSFLSLRERRNPRVPRVGVKGTRIHSTIERKKAASTRKKKLGLKLPHSSRARRQQLKARKKERTLSRLEMHSRLHSLESVSVCLSS